MTKKKKKLDIKLDESVINMVANYTEEDCFISENNFEKNREEYYCRHSYMLEKLSSLKPELVKTSNSYLMILEAQQILKKKYESVENMKNYAKKYGARKAQTFIYKTMSKVYDKLRKKDYKCHDKIVDVNIACKFLEIKIHKNKSINKKEELLLTLEIIKEELKND
jgi:hypothetical protein